VVRPPTSTEPLRFAGKERDAETKFGGRDALDYFGARHFQDQLARFTSVDPLISPKALVNPQAWKLLDGLGYRLHALQKAREGAAHPDRNAQFEHINGTAATFIQRGQPVISVDTKKKEWVGDFKNGGREWQPTGKPERVRVHDFPGDAIGKAIPYGLYDMARNEAWVSVGRDHDTPAFAVASIRQWWTIMGRQAYPAAEALYITADAGGSNGYRTRGWKTALQRLADDLRLAIHVSHFPPGTSKWNKVEHRLFCHITQNWRGRPLRTFETLVELIGHTRTATGLRVKATLDKRRYKTGVVVTKPRCATSHCTRTSFTATGTMNDDRDQRDHSI
jgi:RHS repeat-associated protein